MSSVGKISCGGAKLAAVVIVSLYNHAFGLQTCALKYSLFGWCYSGERAKSESTRTAPPPPTAVRDQKFDDVEPATPSDVRVDVTNYETECPVCFCEYDHVLHKRTVVCRGEESTGIY